MNHQNSSSKPKNCSRSTNTIFPNYNYALYRDKYQITFSNGEPISPGLWEVPMGEYLNTYKPSRNQACSKVKPPFNK